MTLRGRLDLHGVLGDVELNVEPGAVTATGGVDRARYAARGTLDRQAFGLHWNQDLDLGGIVVGDRIEIIADVELVRAADHEADRSTSRARPGRPRPAAHALRRKARRTKELRVGGSGDPQRAAFVRMARRSQTHPSC